MAVSGTAAGHGAGPAQVWTWACCWLRAGGHLPPQGAPERGTGGALRRAGRALQDARASPSRSCLHCCPRSHCWLRLAGAPGVRWGRQATRGSWAGLRPGLAAGRSSRGHCAAAWHSHHCCIASWRQASRPWSRQGATGTGSAPAPLARTGTCSAAWSVVLRAALCSHRGPKHCPHPGLCRGQGTPAATEDPRCAPRHRGLAGRGKQAPWPPGSQQAVLCEKPSRGSRPH